MSIADILMLVKTFPRHDLKFIANKSLKYGIPAISVVLRYGRHAIISKGHDFSQTRREIISLSALWHKHHCPVIFLGG
jgi:hypothetical protein